MPPIRGKPSASSRKARLANTQTHRPKKPRKYYNPAARYVALHAVLNIARDPAYEQGFTIKEAIERAHKISADARHKLGNNATRVTEDYVLFFRHYGYLREVGQSTDEDGEVSITFQAQDSLKDLVQLVENYISDSGLEPSEEDGREVFVAISTHLRETVTPDDLREIAQMHRSSQAQQRLMRDKLVLEEKVKELTGRLAGDGSGNAAASLVTVSDPSTSPAPVVRPNPRRLGDLTNDSFYVDDVEPEAPCPTTTPVRPVVQLSSGSGAYPSPTSLPRPEGGASLQPPGTPSRGNRGMRTPPSSPGVHDEDDEDDSMMVDGYLTNPLASFQSDTSNPRQAFPSPNVNRGRSRVDRRLAALTKLRRRNERVTRAYQAARKELVKQRVETRKEREAGMIKNGEIACLKEMYNTLLGHLKPLAPLIGLPFIS